MSKRTYNGVNFNGKHYNSWTETDDKGNSVTTIYGPEINNTKDNTQISNRNPNQHQNYLPNLTWC